MTFKGVEYELADDIDPNLFVTWDFWSIDGWRKAVIPLLGGGTVTIGATFVEWNNLKQLKLVSCSPVSEIEEFFLSNLSGLHGFSKMGESFVSNCESLENIILPQQDPRQITKVVAVRFLLGLPTDAVIHCGDYLEEYKSTSPWNEWANQMVK